MAIKDPFKVLGVDRSASEEEVKRAYRELAKKYHPDRHSDPVAKELAEDKMAEINQAYESIQSGQYTADSEPYNPFDPFSRQNAGGYNPWANQQNRYERRTYRQSSNPYGNNGSCCRDLWCLCLADSCCECMGGDLIPCC